MKRALLLFCAAAVSSLLSAQVAIDKPIATVKLSKQEIISVRQFKADVDKIEASAKRKLNLEERKQLLDSKVNSLLFFQYCEREKIIAAEAEVNASLAQAKAGLGPGADDVKLEAAFRAQGILIDPRTYIRQQLLFRNYIQAKKAEAVKGLQAPSSEDVLKAYDLLKASLVRPDTLRISVLYVDLRPLAAEDKKKAADAMRQIATQLKASPGKFDEFIIRSSDPGSLYRATPSLYVERTPQFQELYGDLFMERIFKLKAGEQSELIDNDAGLQIVRVNEVLPQKQLGLSDPIPGQQNATIQELIYQNLAQERQAKFLSEVQAELIAQLRKEAQVKIFEENLNF